MSDIDEEVYHKVRQLIKDNKWDELVKLGTPAVGPLLFLLRLKTVLWFQRMEMIRVLGKIGDSRAVTPLIKIMEEESISPRPNPVGEAAAKALAKMKDKGAVDSLIQALRNKDAYGIRMGVVEALGEAGDLQAVDPLTEALQEKCYYPLDIRQKAAKALEDLGWKPRNDTEKIYYLIAKQKWDELPELGELAVEPLGWILRAFGEEIPKDISKGVKGALEAIKAKKRKNDEATNCV